MQPQRGKFITLEGIEGMGKSTHLSFIAERIRARGFEVVTTREPGGTPVAEEIRDILLKHHVEKIEEETEILLLYAGRVQHVRTVILPALLSGKWVISDRFADATFAYQGGGRQIVIEKLNMIHQWALGDFKPDKTFWFQAPVSVGMQRIATRGGRQDRFEKEREDFFERVQNRYQIIAEQEPARVLKINALEDISGVQQQLDKLLNNILK